MVTLNYRQRNETRCRVSFWPGQCWLRFVVSSGHCKIEGNVAKKVYVCVCVRATSWSSNRQQINWCYSIPGQGVAQGTNTESEIRVQGDGEREYEFFYVALNTVHIFVGTWQATAWTQQCNHQHQHQDHHHPPIVHATWQAFRVYKTFYSLRANPSRSSDSAGATAGWITGGGSGRGSGSGSALPCCNTSISGPLSASRIRNEPKPNPNPNCSPVHLPLHLAISVRASPVCLLWWWSYCCHRWGGGHDWLCGRTRGVATLRIERSAISTSIVFAWRDLHQINVFINGQTAQTDRGSSRDAAEGREGGEGQTWTALKTLWKVNKSNGREGGVVGGGNTLNHLSNWHEKFVWQLMTN